MNHHRVVRVPKLHTGQQKALQKAKRGFVLSPGRRWGKSTLLMERLMRKALLTGEPVAYFSPTYRMAMDMYSQLELRLNPVIVTRHKGEYLSLINGATIDVWAVSPTIADRIRGRKYIFAAIDEAAMISGLLKTFNTVIRPTLADLEGEWWIASTPKGLNDFYEMFQRGNNGIDWEAWSNYTAPTSDNPMIAQSEIDAMRTEMPDQIYQQEILAEFLNLDGAVFRNITGCVDLTLEMSFKRQENHSYVIGFDIARVEGGDWTVILVYDTTEQAVVWIDRFQGVPFTIQKDRFKRIVEVFKPDLTIMDATGLGMAVWEDLTRSVDFNIRGLRFNQQVKTHLVEHLIMGFEYQAFRLPNHKVMLTELTAFQSERVATGIKYSAPSGQHDDCVIALSMAYFAGAQMQGKPLFVE